MATNRATKTEQSIKENSEKISQARKAISKKSLDVQNVNISQEDLAHDNWKEKQFAFPNRKIRLATAFSGIGAIEHAFQRLKLNYEIVFAGDIDENCKKS